MDQTRGWGEQRSDAVKCFTPLQGEKVGSKGSREGPVNRKTNWTPRPPTKNEKCSALKKRKRKRIRVTKREEGER